MSLSPVKSNDPSTVSCVFQNLRAKVSTHVLRPERTAPTTTDVRVNLNGVEAHRTQTSEAIVPQGRGHARVVDAASHDAERFAVAHKGVVGYAEGGSRASDSRGEQGTEQNAHARTLRVPQGP